ncbi:hypothetical protein INT47_003798 [Mucor saturninus]|uniref:Uncharacterized protein n=1 Tax=Mucor saturninus TaxID=64648 RepID=A0A8H7R868_9FUNG|nr:hypothetical protein INT47_003798 [Mucor saturninus]
MCELPDNTCTPLPILDSHFAAMVDSSIKKSDESQLFPTDCDARLHASSIFNADSPFLNNSDGDSLRTLYLPPHGYTTLNEMALDNNQGQVSLSVSTFLSPLFSAHDQGQVFLSVSTFFTLVFYAYNHVQLEFDSISWIFKQENANANEVESLRPDVIFYHEHQGMVMEVCCGEVKKPGVSQALFNEDKMRVLEVMKRQLHLRLFHAKKKYEAVTFGILVQGKVSK